VDIVFLDASVLFSAAYRPKATVGKLWNLPNIRLVSSYYAAGEAKRNLTEAHQRDRLAHLLQSVELIASTNEPVLPEGIDLPAKDVLILQAAIAARATHLLTSDVKHFGKYFWQIMEGVTILPPAVHLKKKS
jgi:uncharacterized protein